MLQKLTTIYAVLNTVFFIFKAYGMGPYDRIVVKNKIIFKSRRNNVKYLSYILSK